MQAEACLRPSRNSKEASEAAAERGRDVVVGGEVREQGWVGEGLAEPGFVGPMITTPLLCARWEATGSLEQRRQDLPFILKASPLATALRTDSKCVGGFEGENQE